MRELNMCLSAMAALVSALDKFKSELDDYASTEALELHEDAMESFYLARAYAREAIRNSQAD